jgi:hypothetical protein
VFGFGQNPMNFLCRGVDPIGWDGVVGKRLSVSNRGSKPSGLFIGGRHNICQRQEIPLPLAFIGEEKPGFVLAVEDTRDTNGSAYYTTELVSFELRTWPWTLVGQYGTSIGFTLFIAAQILASSILGILTGEWKATSPRTRRGLAGALVVTLISVIVLNLGGLF